MPTDRASTYEHSDARVRPLVYTGLGLVVLCAIGFVGASIVTGLFERRTNAEFEDASPLFVRDVPKDAPLLTDEPAFAAQFVAEQEKRLSRYGWIDEPNGVVHLPIERAMELIVEESK
ncbi:MAG: hypothetical protein RMA76_15910 [Deltaproteobacteria bacterium]|jgi:hypothetical protein